MKGVIFTAVEQFIRDGWGREAYEDILGSCTLRTTEPFVGPGTYPDEDLLAIATAAAHKLEIPLPDALRAAGQFAFGHLAARVPDLVDCHDDLGSFLETIDSVIHAEVRKLYPGADTPRFVIERVGPSALSLRYQSKRMLCALMEGLLLGAGDAFETDVAFEQSDCMLQGADACLYDVRLTRRAASVA